MFILDVNSACNSASLAIMLRAFKRIVTMVQIIVPILLMISAGIGLFQLVSNPERKNGLKSLLNKVIAAVIVFFIPMFVNLVLGLVGDNTNFSSCWNSLDANRSVSTAKVASGDDNTSRSSFIQNSDDYEKGKKKTTTSNSNSNNNSSSETPVAAVNSNSSNANKVIFVGDSRTVQMYAYLTGQWGGANYSSGGVHVVGNDVFIAQGSKGLDWLKSTGILEASKYFGNGSALIILMGVNDVGNIDSYISYLKSNVSSWTSTGTKVYYSAVTPCNGNYTSHDSAVQKFNSKLSNNLPSGITWIDTYSYLQSTGYTSTDGLHYNKNTSIKIYNYLKSKV